jgi:ATP/ADP translocase/HEAT repeat protein
MLRRLLDVRPEERRITAIAFLVLFGILAAHTILETARDALFLARLPPSQLPWMYLAMAAIAVALSQWSTRRLSGSRALATLLAFCAAGTFTFWAIEAHGPRAVRSLYVWTGLVSTLAAVQFWLVVGEIYTITQAKRLFAVIGLGSLLGAVAGGGLAGVVSSFVNARHLLLLSSVILAATAVGPAMLLRRPDSPVERDRRASGAAEADEPTLAEGLRLIRRHPYLLRLAGLVLISTLALTLADYVFKSAVSRAVPPERLASFFASFYTVLNGLALACQIFLVSWLMRVLGVNRTLWVLPAFLVFGATSVAIGGGLVAALLLKGADGVLRPSLNRMGMELLFVPIPDQTRSFAKPLTDVLGQRGGQALASVFILGWLARGRGDTMLALLSAILCVVWIVWTMNLRSHYLEIFRDGLRNGTLKDTVHLPALDMGALELLFSALNSQNDREVLGALDLLDEEGRARLVPALILYHPSRAVVFRALNILAKSGRVDFVPIADRLFDNPDAEIRAAALRARSTVQPDEAVLRHAAEDPSPLVRATGIVGLVARGWGSDDARQIMEDLLKSSSVETQMAFAQAIERQPAPAFEDIILRLSTSPDSRVLRHVAHAMGTIKSPAFLPKLLLMLAQRDVRLDARAALLEYGDTALRLLDEALDDRTVPPHIRRHIPRTISGFAADQATLVLQKHLLEETDGLVRFKILRALGRLAADHPEVALDQAVLREATARTINAVVDLIHWRVNLVRGAGEQPQRATPGHSLIVMLLQDKERHAVERVFRLLGLTFRREDLRSIHRGLGNANPKVRAGSRELLENLLAPPLRESVLALVDDVEDERRLAGLRPDLASASIEYEAVLTLLLNAPRRTLHSLATYHAGELGLTMNGQREVPESSETSGFASGLIEAARALDGKA